jgi:hypothetical protein
MLKMDGWSIVYVGELLRDPRSGEAAEVDVLAIRGNKAIVIECKGYVTNDVTRDEVDKWLTRKVPRIRGFLLSEKFYKNKEISFQLWTTSKFAADALEYLKHKQHEIRKITFDWLDGPALMKFSMTARSDYAARILREQYQLS